eukprot:5913412-Pleurochrysis_carterae.AAC.1
MRKSTERADAKEHRAGRCARAQSGQMRKSTERADAEEHAQMRKSTASACQRLRVLEGASTTKGEAGGFQKRAEGRNRYSQRRIGSGKRGRKGRFFFAVVATHRRPSTPRRTLIRRCATWRRSSRAPDVLSRIADTLGGVLSFLLLRAEAVHACTSRT